MKIILSVLSLCVCAPSISGFNNNSPLSSSFSSRRSALSLVPLAQTSSPDVVVISPPGGIGEIASVEAARLGGSVRWFVVSAPSLSSSSTGVALTSETLSAIESAGGSIELAGANAASLLVNSDDGNSAASAVSTWCRGARALLCTYDGAEEEKRRADRTKSADERDSGNEDKIIRSSIRVAAREAVGVAAPGVSKIAILSAGEENGDDETTEQKGKGFLQGLFGGNAIQIPETMSEAMQGATAIVRHGELFGAPESSVSHIYRLYKRAASFDQCSLTIFALQTVLFAFCSPSPLHSSEVLAVSQLFVRCIPCAQLESTQQYLYREMLLREGLKQTVLQLEQ